MQLLLPCACAPQVDLAVTMLERKTGGLGAGGGLSSQVSTAPSCACASAQCSTGRCTLILAACWARLCALIKSHTQNNKVRPILK